MPRVAYKPSFLRMLNKLPSALQEEVKSHIALFQKNPKDPSLRVHKLKGSLAGRWSFSVDYSYRIVFIYEDRSEALLLAVGDHSVYQ